jgi:catechol 2,3-dioxygenase-like lactoylglutathione lyase family enzyme
MKEVHVINVSGVTNIEYQVQDLEKSIEFFTNSLGFYLQRRTHKGGRLASSGDARERGEHVFVGIGDTWVELMPPPQAVDPALDYALRTRPNYVFALAVDDLDAAMREMQERGIAMGSVLEHPQSFWGRQVIIDPGQIGQPIALRAFRQPDNTRFKDWHPDALSG